MVHQIVLIHGIGANDAQKNRHGEFVDFLNDELKEAQFYFVQWNDLGFSSKRVRLAADSDPFIPPFEHLLKMDSSPFLFDRMSLLLQIRQRDLVLKHPSWTVQSNIHRAELRLIELMLDYVGDVEVYLRDRAQRGAIQERLADKLSKVSDRGPITVVSHSLGTLVAYDVIHQLMPPSSVQTLVTLGSPLENLLYLTAGFGLVSYDLRLHPSLSWINFYDVKDVIASKLTSGDFDREPRDDWLVRHRLSISELELVHELSGERLSAADFWRGRDPFGVRTNIGVNRESTAFEAHVDYWKSTRHHPVIVHLVAGLLSKQQRKQSGS